MERGDGGGAQGVMVRVMENVTEDCLILVLDAARHAGFSRQALPQAAILKVYQNALREWPDWRTPPGDAALEHVRCGGGDVMDYTLWPTGPCSVALTAVYQERRRQDDLKAAGRFAHTCADEDMKDVERLAILVEEVGEVARCVAEKRGLANDTHGRDLRAELVQVAAVAVAWIEGLDAKRAASVQEKEPSVQEDPK